MRDGYLLYVICVKLYTCLNGNFQPLNKIVFDLTAVCTSYYIGRVNKNIICELSIKKLN